jgi:hypothetical protein
MDPENKNDLFSIHLNNEGASHILRFTKLVRIYLAIGIAFTLIALINDYFLIADLGRQYSSGYLNIYFKIYPFLVIIGVVIFILELIYFRKLGLSLRRAIQQTDENGFNQAFENLTSLTWVAIASSVLAIIYAVMSLIFSLFYRS